MKLRLLASACLLTYLPSAAYAQDDTAAENAFGLGQIIVTSDGTRSDDDVSVGSSTIDQTAIEAFQAGSLDQAINLLPGVVAGNSGGGSRNEGLIFVRGFDRFQVPLSIDGIRVYLPADNRLDLARFLTADVAEVQVAKGYASVLDGPGAMGGAINLVTRKPTEDVEAEARGVLNLDRDLDYAGYTLFGLLGTRQDKWYAQASFTRTIRDHWDLPGSFTPTVNEDGGARDFSDAEDWRVNMKFGFTPNATDEYSVSYTRQEGAKEAPLHLTATANMVRRYWTWPEWNIESLYFLSSTAIGDAVTLKTRAYRSKYYNILRSFDNASHTTQALSRAFDSPYDDTATGGSAQVDIQAGERDRLSLAVHYRRDEHNETQLASPDLPGAAYEPNQQSLENTWSVALENRFEFSDSLSLTVGASYDWRHLIKAEEYNSTTKLVFEYPLADANGWNAQGRLDWTGANGSSAYALVSSRIRFPTLFERFSTSFGTAQPNPDLKPERSTNFEVGGATDLGPVRLGGALFYSALTDTMVSVIAGGLNRRENIGSADYYGGEISLDGQIAPGLTAGLNYTYIHRKLDLGEAPTGTTIKNVQLTDVPAHKGMAWVRWEPLDGLSIMPSVEFTSDRLTVDATSATGNNVPIYFDLDGYVNVALRADYEVSDRLKFGVGVKNLFDEYHLVNDGFPEAGRSFFATVQAKY